MKKRAKEKPKEKRKKSKEREERKEWKIGIRGEVQKPKVERKRKLGEISRAGMKHATVAKHVETHLTV